MESILESIKNLSNSIKEVADDYPETDINKMREHLFAVKEISKKLLKKEEQQSEWNDVEEECLDVYYDSHFKWWFCDKAYFTCHMDDPKYLSKLYNSENQFSMSPDYIKLVDFKKNDLSKYHLKESKYTETKKTKIYYSLKHKKWWFYRIDTRMSRGFKKLEECVSMYYFSTEDVAWDNYQRCIEAEVIKNPKSPKHSKVNRLV